LKRERPAWITRRGSSPLKLSETSEPSGSLRTISYRVWAGRGDLAGHVDLGQALVDDLHVQVGGRERQGVAIGRQQDVRQDRDGVAALDDALHVTQRLQQRRPLDGKLHISVQVQGRRR
jgi:hypothetical protein